MTSVDQALRRLSFGGKSADGAADGRRRAAAALAAAALLACFGGAIACETPAAAPGRGPSHAAAARSNLSAGLGLYESADFTLAARRFEAAGQRARAAGDRALEKQAVTAECTAWLRARELSEFNDCTTHLEYLQRHSRSSDPGVNTLIAMGAIAGNRPLPPFRLPTAIQPLMQQAAQEAP
ncbi:MAG: hypothetical protein JRG90_20755 [Deltaproteobacteria bacterium]|nr:hypothetical protein [Deltaproteobacteria bacterium]MBW2667529.1 hypothetical protein [Deltaproteobacteria bacterium]